MPLTRVAITGVVSSLFAAGLGAGGALLAAGGDSGDRALPETVTRVETKTVTRTRTVQLVRTVTVPATNDTDLPPELEAPDANYPLPYGTLGTASDEDGDGCADEYTGACVDPDAIDLDCSDIGEEIEVTSLGNDPYGLDADGDGYACESYGW